jgi:hypothetical protein
VPSFLRSRWELIFGPGVREMKKLRKRLPNIDMFLHDSDHCYLNQLHEYQIGLKWLSKEGILISHDVINDAFLEVSEEYGADLMVTKEPGKTGFIGVIVR